MEAQDWRFSENRLLTGNNGYPELHDRLVAVTAGYFNIPIVINDPVI
ncbi:hypothetical protein [Desulfonema magnum]|uniref:Uncharacterized protein n=1 Tax=Desulfonema magnum TaxID=45655 RepID=A0A975GME9_9BACT|nr:hypothetical protein [Desulfonema magnum]QTA86595.1 Uncharacterized protein dnm_026190 [Desulfonema magnum]